jgi:hypothetical protein
LSDTTTKKKTKQELIDRADEMIRLCRKQESELLSLAGASGKKRWKEAVSQTWNQTLLQYAAFCGVLALIKDVVESED